MSLIKSSFNDLDHVFDDQFWSLSPKFGGDLATNIYEDNGELIVKMSLPGVQENEVEVVIKGDLLTVAGKRDEEKETKEKDYYSKEIRHGSFTRTLKLPRLVEADKAEAKLADGMLKVSVPMQKGEHNQPVQVKVSK